MYLLGVYFTTSLAIDHSNMGVQLILKSWEGFYYYFFHLLWQPPLPIHTSVHLYGVDF
jgi:hypothetical protein